MHCSYMHAVLSYVAGVRVFLCVCVCVRVCALGCVRVRMCTYTVYSCPEKSLSRNMAGAMIVHTYST